jgi:hypothetical protein
MPSRHLSTTKFAPVSAPARPVAKKSKRGVVRRAAKGALLAAGLAIAQPDEVELTKWRLFDPGLLDRLTMPITRYHE